jgi:mRNA interferase HigB
MRIIKASTLREWMRRHPTARSGLEWWLEIVQIGTWRSLPDLRRTFPAADPVKVASGKLVYVFNISGNAYRLIAAVHFNTGLIYALAFMTHAEYSKNHWKSTL